VVRLRIGIVCDELFTALVGGFGGFGWLAREAADTIARSSGGNIEAVLIAARPRNGGPEAVHGVPTVYKQGSKPRQAVQLWHRRIDRILAIDYRLSYDFVFRALPRTPIMAWLQDPRGAREIADSNTLSIPGSRAPYVEGSWPRGNLGEFERLSVRKRRPFLQAVPAPSLASRCCDAYGVSAAPTCFLPYPMTLEDELVAKASQPTVVFLGRLHAIKRPWLFVELARRFPDVAFEMLGIVGPTEDLGFNLQGLRSNGRLWGHIEGRKKQQLLGQAWALVNTSIHEALPVSFLEALLLRTPIVSCQDPERVVSRFGRYVGNWLGSGLEGIDSFERGLNDLLADGESRAQVADNGRRWVIETHGKVRFMRELMNLL